MSQDFTVVCDVCKTYHHLGQSMGGTYSFGYGSRDRVGAVAALMYVSCHLYCDELDRDHGANPDGTPKSTCGARHLRVVLTDLTPDDYAEEIMKPPPHMTDS